MGRSQGTWAFSSTPRFGDGTEACLKVDPETFFPEPNQRSLRKKARTICGKCPLKDPCREWAIEQTWPLSGIWGGTDGYERRMARRCRAGRCRHGDACRWLRKEDGRWAS